MNVSPDALERAFALARSGSFATVAELERVLQREGFRYDVLVGRQLRAQLKAVMMDARGRVTRVSEASQ